MLIAEDEAHLGSILQNSSSGRGYQVSVYATVAPRSTRLRAEAFDVALLDIVMPEMDGLEVLRQIREELSPPEVIIITGNGTIETAISAMKLGAYDYLAKPYRMAEIDVLVRRAWEKRELARENTLLHKRLSLAEAAAEIVDAVRADAGGARARASAWRAAIRRCSSSASPARERSWSRACCTGCRIARAGPLVDINCAAIPDALVESELFGHERGAHAGGVDAQARTVRARERRHDLHG